MFGHARRLRFVAAVGLVLAAVQAPAWGGESLWKQAADVVCRVLQGPHGLPPLPAEDEDTIHILSGGFRGFRHPRRDNQHKPLFAWEQGAAPFLRSDLLRPSDKQSGRVFLDHQPIGPYGFVDDSNNPAHILPARKDMLPDTERTQVLIEFGIIPDAEKILSPPKAKDYRGGNGSEGWIPGLPINF